MSLDVEINIPIEVHTGETHAQNQHHVVARAAFMNLLVPTPHCKELFMELTQLVGWEEELLYLRAITNELAALKESPKKDMAHLCLLAEVLKVANKKFNQALFDCDSENIVRVVTRYSTADLELPWQWLQEYLIRSWVYSVFAWAKNILVDVNLYYLPQEPKLAAPGFHFQPRHSDKLQNEVARFQEESMLYIKKLKSLNEKHRLPKGWPCKEEIIRRDVEWFFRRRISRESVSRIVDFDRNGNQVEKPQDERYVRKRIKKAEQLLRLAD